MTRFPLLDRSRYINEVCLIQHSGHCSPVSQKRGNTDELTFLRFFLIGTAQTACLGRHKSVFKATTTTTSKLYTELSVVKGQVALQRILYQASISKMHIHVGHRLPVTWVVLRDLTFFAVLKLSYVFKNCIKNLKYYSLKLYFFI